VLGTLNALLAEKHVQPELVQQAIRDLEIDPEKADPAIS
jgi:hypothetical protein